MSKETQQFERDFISLQPAMQRMAEHLLGGEEEAADVVQDCFVVLWNDREKLKNIVNREAWCITMVKRRCVDLLRRRRPTEDVDSLAEEAYVSTDDNERQRIALEMVSRLPERQRQAVNLRHFDGADTQTIATKMNIPEGNVYTLLSRAYTTLRQKIMEYEKR